MLSVSIESESVLPGEVCLGPLAPHIELRKKLFVSRAGHSRDEYRTVLESQFPITDPLAAGRSREETSAGDATLPGVSSLASYKDRLANVAMSPWNWLFASPKWWSWNFTWRTVIRDARHTPAIPILGNMWEWTWAAPYLKIPLACVTGIWLIRVLNVPWSSLWTGVRTVMASISNLGLSHAWRLL